MSDSLRSLIASGTKLYLDSVDPLELEKNLAWGAVGATSNPAIIAEIVSRGVVDTELESLLLSEASDEVVAWQLTDQLVRRAQDRLLPIWEETAGNAGWVSFELDPLLEDPTLELDVAERTRSYIELGKYYSTGHHNRMIKVPATEAGIAALEELAAAGVSLNVTLIFTPAQYEAARDAVWRGARRRTDLSTFKSVYSIFVSRIDVYTDQHVPQLSPAARGRVGIVNAQRIWAANQAFWSKQPTPLEQEIIFASTGTKKPDDVKWKYVEALAGSNIQTNPPETNQAISEASLQFRNALAAAPPPEVVEEIAAKVDVDRMHAVLMAEGVEKFVKPQRQLLQLIAQRRASVGSPTA